MKARRDTSIESKIRIHVESKGIRLPEFFIDYDRLRSGYVTRAQFSRVLDQILKSPLSPEDLDVLLQKYDLKSNSTVNYKQFCASIVQAFPENELTSNPQQFVYKTPEYLGTFRSMAKLTENEEARLQQILTTLNNYYAKRNLDILEKFRDFDRNNIGVLTVSQFVRTMNEPALKEDEMDILCRKYHHPDRPGFINYLNFYNDIKSNPDVFKDSLAVGSSHNRVRNTNGISVQEIIDKISVASYKLGIRVHDFFRDMDPLRSGLVTDRQFITGCSNGLLKPANLCPDDVAQLAEYFRQPGGRVDYRTFCDSVESVFNIPDMEKKPLAQVIRPPRGLLSTTLNGNLTLQEEEQIAACLQSITERVRKYKLQVFPYFKDYDRSTAFTRNVSKIQFGRVLSTLDLMPSAEQFALLCLKFQDSVNGDVNYPLFCQVVDDEYVASIIDEMPLEDDHYPPTKINSNEFPPNLLDIDLNELMARIRSHVLSKRVRVKEFFKDHDPLNSGSITKSQFVRNLNSMGLILNRAQTEVICREYIQANDPLKCNWKKFEADVESVFTLPELEKDPNARVADPNIFILPPPGTVSWDETEALNSTESYKAVTDHLKKVVEQRRLDCWPPFKDYDKLNHGHVTKKQFHQALTKVNLHLSDKEVAVLEAKFMNNKGFNYQDFLSRVQPCVKESAKYQDLKNELNRLNSVKPVFETKPLRDVQSILIKLKDLVFRRRISIYEWLRDHDKLNSGRLLKETFRRAINLCNLDVEQSEIEYIIDYFTSYKDDRMVEYKAFCTEMDRAFSNDELEKNPLVEPCQHVPTDPVSSNKLLPNEVESVEKAMKLIAERVRQQRMQLFPRFEDFDRIKNGYCTQNQFIRVLNDLNLRTVVSQEELENILKKFSVRIGTRDDVNYVAFSDSIHQLASFEFRAP